MGAVLSFLDRKTRLTAYDLFALTILAMILAHGFRAFGLHEGPAVWAQIPAKIMLPVFLFGVGYNTGYGLQRSILLGAAGLVALRLALFYPLWSVSFPMTILVTIIVTRVALEPVMAFAAKGRLRFWAVSAACLALAPLTHKYVSEYGTFGMLFGIAGWLCRNESDDLRAKTCDPREFLFLTYIFYIAFSQSMGDYTMAQLGVLCAGAAGVLAMLYHLRHFILNSLKYKDRGPLARLSQAAGRRALELYILQAVMYYLTVYACAFVESVRPYCEMG